MHTCRKIITVSLQQRFGVIARALNSRPMASLSQCNTRAFVCPGPLHAAYTHFHLRHHNKQSTHFYATKSKVTKGKKSMRSSPAKRISSKSKIILTTTARRPRTHNEFTFSTRYPRQKKIRIPIKKIKKFGKNASEKAKEKQEAQKFRGLKTDLRLASDLHKAGKNGKEEIASATTDSKFALESVSQVPRKAPLASSFAELGVHPDVSKAIQDIFGFSKPTKTQAYWLSKLLSNSDSQNLRHDTVLCAAETGTGKTLAYLTYVMHRLKAQEETYLSHDKSNAELEDGGSVFSELKLYGMDKLRRLKRPRAIIIVPSKELVKQVGGIAKSLSHVCKLRTLYAASEPNSNRKIKDQLKQGPVDLLVCTSGLLLSLMKQDRLSLSELQWLILDEADTLFDTHFSKDMTKVLELLKRIHETKQESHKDGEENPCQVILSTATVPKSLSETLANHFKKASKIITPNVHRTLPSLDQRFYRVHPGITKQNMLLYILRNAVQSTSRIMIFCNQSKTVEDLTAFLQSKRYNVMGLTRSMSQDTEKSDINEWLHSFREVSQEQRNFVYDNTPSSRSKSSSSGLTPFQPTSGTVDPASGSDVRILVATDVGSRGLDTLNVGHVILYDFPVSPIDYLHRVGRTARNGTKGIATSIVSRKDIQIASAIEKSVRQNRPLSG